MLTDTFQLVSLIHCSIGHKLGETRTAKTLVPELFAIPGRPIGETFRVKKIVELAGGPVPLVEKRGQIAPGRRDRLQQCRSVRPSNGRIEINERSDPLRIFVREAGDHGCAKRNSGQINGSGDVQNIEKFVQLADVQIIVIRNARPIGITAAIVVITQYTETGVDQRCECGIPDVIGHAEPGRKNNNSAVGRTTQFVMRVAVT